MNHKGSFGAMESAGAVKVFRRSLPFLNFRFTGYIGDGDSNSYARVVVDSSYDGIDIRKLECAGHVQKRMGRHLRSISLVRSYQMENELSAKGDKLIRSLTQYRSIMNWQLGKMLANFMQDMSAIEIIFKNSISIIVDKRQFSKLFSLSFILPLASCV